ncbi:unnamed protein product [Microthlaspi erraticum]|uniref:Serine-threonine/tyrosine-protein kinase catalytic domain-containing protein n=1 Tax=Microthlaspi erraticum TaxID=1685480 RepID=A0A6D2JEI6_9BRAS|nr:unnamed protein product [Microthlaspi erraticum]
MVLKLGLLCSHSDPHARPTMRQVLNYLNGDAMLPDLSPLDLRGNGMMLGIHHRVGELVMSNGGSSMVDSTLWRKMIMYVCVLQFIYTESTMEMSDDTKFTESKPQFRCRAQKTT